MFKNTCDPTDSAPSMCHLSLFFEFIYQIRYLGGNNQPRYTILELNREEYEKGNLVFKELVERRKYNENIEEYAEFLQQGVDRYGK